MSTDKEKKILSPGQQAIFFSVTVPVLPLSINSRSKIRKRRKGKKWRKKEQNKCILLVWSGHVLSLKYESNRW